MVQKSTMCWYFDRQFERSQMPAIAMALASRDPDEGTCHESVFRSQQKIVACSLFYENI